MAMDVISLSQFFFQRYGNSSGKQGSLNGKDNKFEVSVRRAGIYDEEKSKRRGIRGDPCVSQENVRQPVTDRTSL